MKILRDEIEIENDKRKVIEGALAVCRKKGPKFTMDDVAKEIGMSKKTIYQIMRDKNDLLYKMIDYVFDDIKEKENEFLADNSLSTVEKLKAVLSAMPENLKGIDFTNMFLVKEKFPECHKRAIERIESEWETTVALIDKAKKEGAIRDVDVTIFKLMYNATLERFIQGAELKKNRIKYVDALNEMTEIMISGITK